jgi:hypothetical protein
MPATTQSIVHLTQIPTAGFRFIFPGVTLNHHCLGDRSTRHARRFEGSGPGATLNPTVLNKLVRLVLEISYEF